MQMISQTSVSKYSRGQWASRWKSLHNRMMKVQQSTEHTVEKAAVSLTSFGVYSGAYYAKRRLELAGKRTSFDKKGRFDVFLLGGLALTVLGISPFAGKYDRGVAAAGVSLMSVGAAPHIDKLAQEHAKK